jgi:hypothetical protein
LTGARPTDRSLRNVGSVLAAWRADGIAGLALAIAIAAVWLRWLLPRGFLRGVGTYWRIDISDTTQYLSGFNAFFAEPWAWPLLKIRGLNVPEGTLATFVDVIPLYASLLKLVVPGDRFPFNPYGYWVGLCYVLLAVGAWWLLREARLPRYSALIALTCLVLVMPALNVRLAMGHVSLTSHWLIPFALALYLRSGRSGRPVLTPWTLLLFGAVYVNLYLFAMVGLVFAADVARFGLSIGWRRMLGCVLLPPILILGSLPLTMLPIPHVPGAPEQGFGSYGMNLLGPLVGGGWVTGGGAWAVEGPYDGYNYLGAGVLLLVGGGIILRLIHDPWFFGRHWSLVVVCVLASVYAVSNRVFVADRLVLAWPVPSSLDWLVGTFRASGRFFWLVSYALVCFAVVTLARWLPPRLAGGVLASALVLQWLDLQPIHGPVRAELKRPPMRIVDSRLWDAALAPDVRTIYLEPPYGCGRAPHPHHGILAVQRFVAERQLRLTTGYIARYHPPCDAGPREIARSDPKQSVYVFLLGEAAADSPADYFPPGARLRCRELDIAVACRWLETVARE